MKKYINLFKHLILLSVSSLVSQSQAADKFYVGTGYGGIESESYYWVADEKNMNLQLGYQISPGFSIET